MKNKIIIFLILTSFSGFGQGIYRTLPMVTNTADSMKPVSNAQKAAIVQKLQTVASISALQSFTDANVATFDGSQWDKKAGNVASNGGTYGGTVVNVNASFYWQRKIHSGLANPKMFGAKGDGNTDDTQALLNCFAAHKNIEFSEGTYILRSPITMNFHTVTAPRFGVFIFCAGTDGFYFTKNTYNKLSNIYMIEYSTNLATPETKLKTALTFNGVLNSPCYNTLIDNVYISGFNIGAYGSYLSETTFNEFKTNNVNKGIVWFGQCINSKITSSHILASNIGVETVRDEALNNVGEGLLISNTLIANCDIALKSNGFLLLSIDNCIFDLNISSALWLQNCKSLKVSNTWLYSQGRTVIFNVVNSGIGDGMINQSVSFSNNIIESVQDIAIIVFSGNQDMTFTNNKIITSGNANAYLFNSDANTKDIVFSNNSVKTSLVPYNIFIGGGNTICAGNVGDALPYYADPSKRNIVKDNFSQSIETKYTTFPTTGIWIKGDRIINSNPAVGQPKAWICTVAGTPGTWVSEGNL